MTEPLHITFIVERDSWITSNSRLHWAKKAAAVASLRGCAYLLGRTVLEAARVPRKACPVWTREKPCRVTVAVGMPTRRRFDLTNVEPTVKPLIDGLVEAGFFEDDDSQVIREVMFVQADEKPPVRGSYILRFTIEDATAGEVQA